MNKNQMVAVMVVFVFVVVSMLLYTLFKHNTTSKITADIIEDEGVEVTQDDIFGIDNDISEPEEEITPNNDDSQYIYPDAIEDIPETTTVELPAIDEEEILQELTTQQPSTVYNSPTTGPGDLALLLSVTGGLLAAFLTYRFQYN